MLPYLINPAISQKEGVPFLTIFIVFAGLLFLIGGMAGARDAVNRGAKDRRDNISETRACLAASAAGIACIFLGVWVIYLLAAVVVALLGWVLARVLIWTWALTVDFAKLFPRTRYIAFGGKKVKD